MVEGRCKKKVTGLARVESPEKVSGFFFADCFLPLEPTSGLSVTTAEHDAALREGIAHPPYMAYLSYRSEASLGGASGSELPRTPLFHALGCIRGRGDSSVR